ncbi:glycosyltransferase family 2 protein [Candidatus Microgenomates bacterium]|nr:MAG: glycosyltransferase family 2 protein [Candidatus Microgenomates bacterium]
MKLSVVIPNYNGLSLLKANLDQVTRRLKAAQIIIVDDGSTDASVAFLKKHFPKLTLIEKVHNDGFATSVNLGVKAAAGEIILLLNTDAVPKNGFEVEALRHFTNPQVFAVACMDESIEGDKTVLRGRGVGRFHHGFLMHSRGDVHQTDTLWASGGSSFFRKSIWEKLNGMDELFDPFYWEDIDLSYRALKSGFKILFEPKSVVEHTHDVGSIRKHYSKSNVAEISFRNQIMFVWKNITDVWYLFEHALYVPYHLLTKGKNFRKGFLHALLLLPQILQNRKTQQPNFAVSDHNVLHQLAT